MEYGIFNKVITSIYEIPFEIKMMENVKVSSISDEGLHGMGVVILDNEVNGFLPIRTHYNYYGFVRTKDLLLISLLDLKKWESSNLMVINTNIADVVSMPKVQAVRIVTLTKGAVVEVLEWENEHNGWAKIRLADGKCGYMKNQFLTEKKFSQEDLWEDELPQNNTINESEFRNEVVTEAKKYCGIQYRWGGKTTLGIDCSGLTSMCYMLQGILIYRDAKIKNGFPVKEIPIIAKKKGDLLFFPGHIAMYIGGDRYIHATAKKGSDGVVINSLNPDHPDYREDLAKSMYAVGSIFD